MQLRPIALNVRLPSELHTALRALAAEEERSLNSLIVRILRAATQTDSRYPPGSDGTGAATGASPTRR